MENFEWACFQSQQAGEKALKALWLYNHFDPWGHSLTKLIIDFPDKEMQKNELNPLLEHARHLDKLYIPTRYPNGLPDLSPFEVYDKNDSLNGIAAGKAILEAISLLMADS